MTPARLLLGLAAGDLLVCGLWLGLRPGDLFGLLGLPPLSDKVFLARLLGGLIVGEGLCLVLASAVPAWRSLAWAAWWGCVFGVGMGLFLMGTNRVMLPRPVLAGLVGHATVGLVLVTTGLWLARRE